MPGIELWSFPPLLRTTLGPISLTIWNFWCRGFRACDGSWEESALWARNLSARCTWATLIQAARFQHLLYLWIGWTFQAELCFFRIEWQFLHFNLRLEGSWCYPARRLTIRAGPISFPPQSLLRVWCQELVLRLVKDFRDSESEKKRQHVVFAVRFELIVTC